MFALYLAQSLLAGDVCCLISVVSEVTYLDINLKSKQIKKENKGKSGVYRFTNKENGKSYVGSSSNLSKRFSDYFNVNRLAKYAKTSLICRALLRYGYSMFSLEILEYCGKDKAVILKKEQDYIDLLKPEYNILSLAGSSLGYKHSKDALAKIKAGTKAAALNRTQEAHAKFSATRIGSKHTESSKLKMRAAALNRSKEIKEKNRAALAESNISNKGKAVEVTNLVTNETFEYISVREASRALNVSQLNISKVSSHIKTNINFGGRCLMINRPLFGDVSYSKQTVPSIPFKLNTSPPQTGQPTCATHNLHKTKFFLPDDVEEFLTPATLASLISKHGFFEKKGKRVIISTDSYPLDKINILLDVLRNKFNLSSYALKHGKKGYVIAIASRAIPLLQLILGPFMEKEMRHKINLK